MLAHLNLYNSGVHDVKRPQLLYSCYGLCFEILDDC